MFTSFFNNSKPVHFILIGFIAFISYIFFNTCLPTPENSSLSFLSNLGMLLLFLVLTLFINAVLPKNKIEDRNIYASFIFLIFCTIFPFIYIEHIIIPGAICLVLGIRRALAIHTQQQIVRKIFDSFFLIATAVLLFPPALPFLLVPFFCLRKFTVKKYSNWLIIFPALFALLMLITIYTLIVHNRFFNPFSLFHFSFSRFSLTESKEIIGPFLLLTLFTVWISLRLFHKKITQTLSGKKINSILLSSLFLSVITVILSVDYLNHLSAAFLFVIMPVSLLSSKYFEMRMRNRKIKEILLTVLIVSSLVSAFNSVFHFLF